VPTTAEELAALGTQLRILGERYPGEMMFAIMEALIDIACGDNPALRDYKRLCIYRGVLQKLAKKGIK
jgi:hypothetical protein